ncbi:MAG TPA: Wzz/FepE/Etk N-terminal domain-containing protein [Verrucomicrobiae bacterium]|nr:Wzz/FepE/Etk N-terminal domain-containing protein [Verrucomicrobiae bacterium]
MNENHRAGAPPSIGLEDILFVIFRHKWKIISISLLGIIATASLPKVMRPKYMSEAKLLIKYVVEGRSPQEVGGGQSTVQAVDGGIMNTELEILTSSDLALQVVDAIGAQKILAAYGGGTNRFTAAAVVRNTKNLITETPSKSTVIRIEYRHPDPEVAQMVVTNLIDSYMKKHAEIHRGGGFDEFLTRETDQLHSQLIGTEESLRKEKSRLGIVSLEQARKFQDDQISRLREKLMDAQAQLAEREAVFTEIARLTNEPQLTPVVKAAAPPTDAPAPAVIAPEKIAEYQAVLSLLADLRKKEQNLLLTFTPASSFVKELQERIAANVKAKQQMEHENPGLVSVRLPEPITASGKTEYAAAPQTNGLAATKAEIEGLRAKIGALQSQLGDIIKSAQNLGESEPSLLELQRRKALEEGYYSNFSQSLEQSHLNEQMGAGRISNISIIQAPSPPGLADSKLRKLMAMSLAGSLGFAFGLAFLLEFFLDRSIKRPADIETKLQLPLFMYIPKLSFEGKRLALANGEPTPLLSQGKGEEAPTENGNDHPAVAQGPNGNGHSEQELEIALWDPANKLRPFSEALRDRLITHFEVNNLTHKPKLVAVTSCSEGAGTSTVAAGLAASLSETGEGNVLLVDMNNESASAHHFYYGDLKCGIDEALAREKRESALVQDKLYFVSELPSTEKMQSALPRRFRDLVPKLKASDFDYIVFDMPPITQVSITPRLARFTDITLVVAEAEKTDRDVLKRAIALLKGAKVDVGVVLNKTRSYVPRLFLKEF